jgi:hypothetical protein
LPWANQPCMGARYAFSRLVARKPTNRRTSLRDSYERREITRFWLLSQRSTVGKVSILPLSSRHSGQACGIGNGIASRSRSTTQFLKGLSMSCSDCRLSALRDRDRRSELALRIDQPKETALESFTVPASLMVHWQTQSVAHVGIRRLD